MNLLPNIEIIDLAIYLKKEKTLIIADTHIGYEEYLNKEGILVPRFQFEDVIKRLDDIFSKLKKKKIEQIIVNGDIKHEFGTISEQEWRNTLKLIDFLARKGKLTLIKGNHDTILGPIARKRGLEIVEKYEIGEVSVIHGNKIISDKGINSSKTLIIGHEHPAISLREGVKVEKYKCFLLGKPPKSIDFGGAKNSKNFLACGKQQLIVMPSFLPIIEGTNMTKERLLSPYLSGNIGDFDVFAIGDKTYRFGKLNGIK